MAGELACDGDRDNRAPLATLLERLPALMETASAPIGACAHGLRLALSAFGECDAFP